MNLKCKSSLHILYFTGLVASCSKLLWHLFSYCCILEARKLVVKREREREFHLDLGILVSWNCLLKIHWNRHPSLKTLHSTNAWIVSATLENQPIQHPWACYLSFDICHTSRPKSNITAWNSWSQLGTDVLIVVCVPVCVPFDGLKRVTTSCLTCVMFTSVGRMDIFQRVPTLAFSRDTGHFGIFLCKCLYSN